MGDCSLTECMISKTIDRDMRMSMQVQESDMHRVAVATGAQTQTTVNNLNPKVLGSVEAFEEKQVCPCLQDCAAPDKQCVIMHLSC